ncbi:hypothetical protein ASE01_09560 [Nocardioides sp. Root190]|uniref:alpha/beta fold hydrolase n=1 Tax=Nocardioides sp. Root190 TaxID=1736488 RepID=UPI0006F7BA57|nr:alpha/beta fold hydrolase [Nocardioides sp. Root190]KRB77001.1 hypothetical protein ASE01_09560 [Nocardioides sp. Root190]
MAASGRTGALVLAGSSGRVDEARVEVLTAAGVVAESMRWFGGPGQHAGPWEIPLEGFLERVADLKRRCDRVVVVGTSFGAEAALLTGAHSDDVDAVVAFAPSDLVWAGVTGGGRVTSHWTLDGTPLPFVPFDETWVAAEEPPAFRDLYARSRERFADLVPDATIPVERINDLLLVAGGDDRVWPALDHARAISARRTTAGLVTTIVTDAEAGHRTVLPGEPVVSGGVRMQRGGTEIADRRLGEACWPQVLATMGNPHH